MRRRRHPRTGRTAPDAQESGRCASVRDWWRDRRPSPPAASLVACVWLHPRDATAAERLHRAASLARLVYLWPGDAVVFREDGSVHAAVGGADTESSLDRLDEFIAASVSAGVGVVYAQQRRDEGAQAFGARFAQAIRRTGSG